MALITIIEVPPDFTEVCEKPEGQRRNYKEEEWGGGGVGVIVTQ